MLSFNIIVQSLMFIVLININLLSFAQSKHFTKNYFNNTIHIIEVDNFTEIKPVAKRAGSNLYNFVKDNKSWGGINGGFFNHSDGYPVSKVYINSQLVENPQKNKSLVNNKALKPILDKIFNRSELRFSEHNGKKTINICANNYSPDGEIRIYSLQAGPQLLPNITLEEEGFIIKDNKGNIIRDGISSFSKVARSAVGITKENHLIFISTTSKSGVTINQLSNIMKDLKAVKAMALDGGSSVSMVWSENGKYNYFSSMGKNLAVINSALLFNN